MRANSEKESRDTDKRAAELVEMLRKDDPGVLDTILRAADSSRQPGGTEEYTGEQKIRIHELNLLFLTRVIKYLVLAGTVLVVFLGFLAYKEQYALIKEIAVGVGMFGAGALTRFIRR